MKTMLKQAFNVALLTSSPTDRVANEPESILHSTGIVLLVGISFTLGLSGIFDPKFTEDQSWGGLSDRFIALWIIIITTLVGWILWSCSVYLFASKFLGSGAHFKLIMRSLGSCYLPGILLAFIKNPYNESFPVGPILFGIGMVWILVSAIKINLKVQDIDWVGGILAIVPGWFLAGLIFNLLMSWFT